MIEQTLLDIQEHPEAMAVFVVLTLGVCVTFLFRKAVIKWAKRLKI